MSGRYSKGQKRCQVCEIFINHEGKFCPCCGCRLRAKPRNKKYKFQFDGIKTDYEIKTVFCGSGIDPKLQLKIKDEYLKAVPRMTHIQFLALEESIKQDGLNEPISVNKLGEILDGHTRYSICSKLDIPVKYMVKNFKTLDDERRFVVSTNLKRRQLTPFQIMVLSQSIRRSINDEVKEKNSEHLSLIRQGKADKIDPRTRLENSTRYKLGEITGLSPSTVDKGNYVIDHGTKSELALLENNTKSLEEVYNKVKNRRHQDPDNIVRNRRVFSQCERCGADTRFKGKCHVHKQFCCKKCSWGK